MAPSGRQQAGRHQKAQVLQKPREKNEKQQATDRKRNQNETPPQQRERMRMRRLQQKAKEAAQQKHQPRGTTTPNQAMSRQEQARLAQTENQDGKRQPCRRGAAPLHARRMVSTLRIRKGRHRKRSTYLPAPPLAADQH